VEALRTKMNLDEGYYREELNPPIWAEGTLVGCILLVSGILFYQLLSGNKLGPNPAPNWVLAVVDALLIGVYITFRRLVIILDPEGLQLSFSWIKRRIRYSEVESAELYSVSPEEYWGLGLRYSIRGGEAFTNRFGEGVRITRRRSQPIVLTPENPRRFIKVMREFNETNSM